MSPNPASSSASSGSEPSGSASSGSASSKEPSSRPSWLTDRVVEMLVEAGRRSLPSRDVPTAAAVLYKELVIVGWNDAAASLNAAGHAEINALTNAIHHFGSAQRFKDLDRERLYFVTTYEPCPMCIGALAEHKIKPENIVVLMRKDDPYRQSEIAAAEAVRNGFCYVGYDEVQMALFWQHPGYREYRLKRDRGDAE